MPSPSLTTASARFYEPPIIFHFTWGNPTISIKPQIDQNFPLEMDAADFDRITTDFVRSAQLVQEAGFDAVELHCGHVRRRGSLATMF